jgi:NADPH:quinone reductase-like Zn-dependent oxidoreductase
VVEAVGAKVTGFAAGDEVCGMAGARMGAHAEYVAVGAKRLAGKPDGVSHDDAAGLLFGGSAALFFLRDKGKVRPGMSVLVNGASGAIGTNAVQLARFFGATVTGVASAANVGLVTGLGAQRVVDYASEDLASVAEQFDLVLDAVGNVSIPAGRRLLTGQGVLLLAVADLWQMLRARGNVAAGVAPERVVDFELLLQMVVDGAITVVHDRAFDLADIAEAHRRVDTGHKVGNVVVRP